ncbi:hypothetical protein A2U01_0107992, partial [Trifolium medium]|nr:hypothetical protein [Trifolium medium]
MISCHRLYHHVIDVYFEVFANLIEEYSILEPLVCCSGVLESK